jgi:hypothetical protein
MLVTNFTEAARSGGIAQVRGVHTEDRYRATGLFRAYDPALFPGPLQAPEYARAVQESWAAHLCPGQGDAERAASVAEAVTGQQLRARLALDGVFEAVIEEAALTAAVGGTLVLAAQLEHLLRLIRDTAGLTVAVIPRGESRDIPPMGPLWLFDDELAASEAAWAEVATDDRAEVAACAARFALLKEAAVTGYQARLIISDALKAVSRG